MTTYISRSDPKTADEFKALFISFLKLKQNILDDILGIEMDYYLNENKLSLSEAKKVEASLRDCITLASKDQENHNDLDKKIRETMELFRRYNLYNIQKYLPRE